MRRWPAHLAVRRSCRPRHGDRSVPGRDRAGEGTARATDIPIDFLHVAFEDFAAASEAGAFDVGLLSWSLC